MSKEIAKKLITELQTNAELKAKIAGITDPAEMVKKAASAGYDVTLEEMTEAEKEFRAEMAKKADELESAAGGRFWAAEERSDGKEYNCNVCNLKYDDQKEKGDWCKRQSYCETNNIKYDPHPAGGGGGGYVK